MSKQFDETNRGSIWPNRKKEKDTHPDFTGQINVDGKDYWVSAWKKKPDARENAPSLTFSVKPKDGQVPKHNESTSSKPSAATRRGSMKDALDDDIPFAPEFR